jgi:hypothetical protein
LTAPRFTASYRIRSDAASIAARAEAIAVEQSVGARLRHRRSESTRHRRRVAAIEQRGDDLFDVHIALATATSLDAGVPQHGVRRHLAAPMSCC